MPHLQGRPIFVRRLLMAVSLTLAGAAILPTFFVARLQTVVRAAAVHAAGSSNGHEWRPEIRQANESVVDSLWMNNGPRGGVVLAIATSKSSPSVVYAYISASGRDANDRSRNGLFKSPDGGAHWVKTSFPSESVLNTVYSLAVDPLNPSIIYAGTFRNGIFKSSDGGITWGGPYSQPERQVISLVIDPATTTTLYASLSGFGVYKSTNGGLTWTLSNTGISFYGISSLAIDPANPNTVYAAGGPAGPGQFAGVFKSADGGANWSRQSDGLPYIQSVTAIAVDPTNTSTLYVATTDGVFKSVDGGANWGPSSAGLLPGDRIISVAVNPSNPAILVAASFDAHGLYRSADAGATWTLVTADGTRFNALAFDSSGANVYAGSVGTGVFRSADGGSAWGQSNEGLPFALVTQLTADPNNFATVHAGAADGIYNSLDKGASWSAAGFNDFGRAVRGLVADLRKPLTMYAALDYVGVVKTTDGGRTWTLVLSANNNPVNTLAIDPSNPQVLYFARPFRLFKTTDGGATWTQINNRDITMLAVDPQSSSVVYAVSNTGLLKSANGGTTWSVLPFDASGLTSVHGLTIDPATPNTLYAYATGSANPVRKSTDGGATWTPASAGLPATSAGAYRVLSLVTDPLNTAVLYAACNGPTATGGGVYRSVAGGASWELFQSTLDQINVLSISPSGKTLYAGADGGVYVSQTPPSAISFSADVFEASEGAGTATITVTRADATGALSITHGTADGSATSGHDYAGTFGLLNFAPGETSKTFNVPLLDDATDEFDEGVVLNISSVGGAPRLLGRASLVIVDDDPPPAISVSDASAPEGDFDTTNFVFNVSLSAPSAKTVSVDLNFVGGSAVVGTDLFHFGGPLTLVYAPGETVKAVTLAIRGDLDIEPDETFFVNLVNPVNAAPGDSHGQGTILNDDFTPTVSLSINDVSVVEGNYGTTDAVFTVTLSGATTKTVKVDYSSFGYGVGTLTFAPGETMKSFTLRVPGNNFYNYEGNGGGEVRLRNPLNALLADDLGILTVINDESPPVLTVDDVSVREGDSGTKEAIFTVKLSVPIRGRSLTFTYTTAPETATSTEYLVTPVGPEDYNLTFGITPIFIEGFTIYQIAVPIRGDTRVEGNETFFFRILEASGVAIADGVARCTIIDDDGSVAPSFQFSASEYKAPEGGQDMIATVLRSGDLSAPATVNYSTRAVAGPRAASERSDYTTAMGTLRFAAGEESKTFRVLITDDVFAEGDPSLGDELVELVLSDPTGSVSLAEPQVATITIIENDAVTGGKNPSDDPTFFVRQHYHDFLNREPDNAGLNFWANQITACGANAQCIEAARINVSAAFFLSIEFQQTGYQAIRFYKASFTDSPQRPRGFPRYREFLRDSQELGRGVVVGVGDWEQQLRDNTLAFARRWVNGAEFVARFPEGMTAMQFVDKLFANSGAAPTQAERDAALTAFGAGGNEGRANALLSVTNSASVNVGQQRLAFVLMQYIGYLRRSPDDPPDTNFDGYDFWLGKLNQFNGNYIQAEMIKAFISSIEHRRRFAP